MKKTSKYFLFITFVLFFIILPRSFAKDNNAETLDIKKTIEQAISSNLDIKIAEEKTKASKQALYSSMTNFLPTISTNYQYKKNEEASLLSPEKYSNMTITAVQPIFVGFSIIDQYKLAALALDNAKLNEKIVKRDIELEANEKYFSVLKAEKLMEVAEDSVKALIVHKNVAESYYNVGQTPLNDVLKADVELANAKLSLVTALNNVKIAKASLKSFLKISYDKEIVLEDVKHYTPFEHDFDFCIEKAKQNRTEIAASDIEIEMGKKNVKLQEKDFYPNINLVGTYSKTGNDLNINDAEGLSNPDTWNVSVAAEWELKWGRTCFSRKEKIHELNQVRIKKEQLLEAIYLSVKNAFLKTMEAEQNIETVEKAVEQAKENFRIVNESYKQQIADTTDVLDANTLLTQTKTNYYNALYDFYIAKSDIIKEMGGNE